jgi:DNA repair protein RadA/Sms
LIEVLNPSDLLLAQRFKDSVGSVVVPTIEGNRPLLLEIQALTNPTKFTAPRRVGNGIDFGRLLLITAVLSRRVGLKLGNQDILINVTGGLRVEEPAADLGVALAIVSSYKDKGIVHQLAAVGEIGLSGEIRSVAKLNHRLNEAVRLGFKYCLVPKVNEYITSGDIEIIPVTNIKEAINLTFIK